MIVSHHSLSERAGNSCFRLCKEKLEVITEVFQAQQQTAMVCNIVGHVTGLFSESQYVALDKLSGTQKKRPHPLNKLLRTIISTWEAVGFHGRSGMYLDATGVHMQHWLDPPHTFGFADWDLWAHAPKSKIGCLRDSDCVYLTIEVVSGSWNCDGFCDC
ncbi:hypothetical protein RHGRI_013975 [Rhododendron griersonianum]|uniref:Uncharacterized protein n=1 Tax=Rhododendron griersonianum TaxID=479676 RepID=A0AAV6K7M1_9ERIC|nr:hypothetical protein RHGRI_013975 [Rhododendron griersonianum]